MTQLAEEDFGAFFASLNDGHAPFEWQRRLLHRVLATGQWPDVIDSPTGTGKSSVIDVHLFAQALVAANGGPFLPRRLVITVDRRALVDSHWDHACRIRELFSSCDSNGVLAEVRSQLESLDTFGFDDAAPFRVARVRGGEVPDRDWVNHPSACEVIAATPDMAGSRLLFRGYGASRYARPREAGLLAFDTVIVVDEAHINQQLLKTARRVSEMSRLKCEQIGVAALQVVAMTATPAVGSGEPVGVVDADLGGGDEGSLLRRRLLAAKPVTLRESPMPVSARPTAKQFKEGAATIAGEVLGALGLVRETHSGGKPVTVGCIVNTVRMAVEVAAQLRASLGAGVMKDMDPVVTLVGRMRAYELEDLKNKHHGLFSLKGDRSVSVVVATQTLEVGVDMDFAALVTELAPGSAIAQRAGRVNRSGAWPGAPIIVVRPTGRIANDTRVGPYLGKELNEAEEWLAQCAKSPLGLAPWRLHPKGGNLVPPEAAKRRPVFQRVETWDVDDWARTSDDLAADPWLDLWLSDSLDPDLSVGFVVRQGLPSDLASAVQQIQATPPLPHEVFPARMSDAREIVKSCHARQQLFLMRGDRVWPLGDDVEEVNLKPDDLLITDSVAAFTRESVIVSESPDEFVPPDVGELGNSELVFGRLKRRWVRLGMETPLADCLGSELMKQILVEVKSILIREDDSAGAGDNLAEILETIRDGIAKRSVDATDSRIILLRQILDPVRRKNVPDMFYAYVNEDDDPSDIGNFWIVLRTHNSWLMEDDIIQTSSPRGRVDLETHEQKVCEAVEMLANELGLADEVNKALRRSAELHDEGKKDTRFQRILYWPWAPNIDRPLAKSGVRRRDVARKAWQAIGLGNWRHEQLSAAMAWSTLNEKPSEFRDIVVRLVGTSHGYGRHEFPHVGSELAPGGEHADAIELYDNSEWELVLERTERMYGPWGCAYLEALLRAADCETSRSGS